jgi:hypothetical protein
MVRIQVFFWNNLLDSIELKDNIFFLSIDNNYNYYNYK